MSKHAMNDQQRLENNWKERHDLIEKDFSQSINTGHVSMQKDSTKSESKYRMPGKLWKLLKKHLPKEPNVRKPGRPPVSNRNVLDGIWHVLWTGCQWKSIEKEWFNASNSVLHERFQTWQSAGLFEKLFKKMVKYYARECKIGWDGNLLTVWAAHRH